MHFGGFSMEKLFSPNLIKTDTIYKMFAKTYSNGEPIVFVDPSYKGDLQGDLCIKGEPK